MKKTNFYQNKSSYVDADKPVMKLNLMNERSSSESLVTSDSVPAYSTSYQSDQTSRREFLRTLLAGIGSAVVGGLYGCGGGDTGTGTAAGAGSAAGTTSAAALIENPEFWAGVQDLFVTDGSAKILNVDVGAVAPSISVEALRSKSKLTNGMESAVAFTDLTKQRSQIASGNGADLEDVALTNGATAALTAVFAGIDWIPGDTVFYTDHEHPNTLSVLSLIASFYRLNLHRIILPSVRLQTAEAISSKIEEEIANSVSLGETPRALVWSSPTYQTGTMLPIARLVRIASKYNLITICDAAHLIGMAALDYRRLGVDFLAASGHKWQCGPNATGILFGRSRENSFGAAPIKLRSGVILNAAARQGAPDRAFAAAELSRTPASAVSKFDSLAASSALWDTLGRSRIEAYTVSIGAYLKQKIILGWGDHSLASPHRDVELLSGITSFDPLVGTRLQGHLPAYSEFVRSMRDDHGFVVRQVLIPNSSGQTETPAIRICTPLWITARDIDRAADAMEELTKSVIKQSPSLLSRRNV